MEKKTVGGKFMLSLVVSLLGILATILLTQMGGIIIGGR